MAINAVTKTKLTSSRDVYIVDGARTPFLRSRHKPGVFSASDLAVKVGGELLLRQPFQPEALEEVVLGCVMPNANEANIARIVALRLGCGDSIPAWTVQRNCASGMQALDSAMKDVATGRYDLVLAGGTEAMSRAPLLFNQRAVNWLSGFYSAKTKGSKFKSLLQMRLNFIYPIIALAQGLTDPTNNLSMGQTAENVAYRFNISREAMDAFAVESHQRVINAQKNHYFSEILPIFDNTGGYYTEDDGVRSDSSVDKLKTLRPIFDKFGQVTAGNSSQVTDGAALLLLASKDAVKKYNLPVLAKITDVEWAGLDPAEMGLGPVYASTKLLQRNHLTMDDIDFWEINEAFAAQVLGCLAAFESDDYCQHYLGLPKALGKIDPSRLNVDGGAVALGHPVGASGARIVLHLIHILKRHGAKKGMATICIGGGQGGAMLIENCTEVSE